MFEKNQKITLPENPTCVSFSFGISWWEYWCCHIVLAMAAWPAGWLDLLSGWTAVWLAWWPAAWLADAWLAGWPACFLRKAWENLVRLWESLGRLGKA